MMYYVCLDNEEVYKIAIPEKRELEELTHSGGLLITKHNVTHTDVYL